MQRNCLSYHVGKNSTSRYVSIDCHNIVKLDRQKKSAVIERHQLQL
jgi:hypothetical protein